MAGIRTVMVTTPTIIGDLIKRLAVGPIQLDVVAELDGHKGLVRRLKQLRPRLVILGSGDVGATEISALLNALPEAKFVVFSRDHRNIVGYELRLRRIELADLSPEAFIGFIMDVAGGIEA